MAAGLYNFTIEQGATLNFELQYKDANGQPIDLTGYVGRMEIASNYLGQSPRTVYAVLNSVTGSFPTGSALISGSLLSFSGSNFDTPPTSGSIGVYMGYYTTDNLTFTGSAFYDLEITYGTTKTRLLQGKVQLSQQVTNS